MRAAAVHEALAKANFERDAGFFTPGVAARVGITLHENTFPILDATVNHARPIRFKMNAPQWNELPASVRILKPNGEDWRDPLPGDVFNGGPHRHTGLPFICMRGALEYHTHESHLNDKWESHRNVDGNNLVGLLMQLAAAWNRVNP
jgi:hypothetical protein